MKLSEYAAKHGIQYRAAWNRFKAGKIPGAWQDESGTIIVPDETQARLNDAAVYARVSDPSKRKTQLPAQQKRVEDWAIVLREGTPSFRTVGNHAGLFWFSMYRFNVSTGAPPAVPA